MYTNVWYVAARSEDLKVLMNRFLCVCLGVTLSFTGIQRVRRRV